MNTSYCKISKEARKFCKEEGVKEEEAGNISGNSSTDSVKS
jgi:hypothetical protein